MRTSKATRGPHYNADATTAVPELPRNIFCIFIYKFLNRNAVTWRPETGDRQHRGLLPQHSPKLLTRNPVMCFLEVVKVCVNVFGILPRFLKNLLVSENLVCIVLWPGWTPHWVSSSIGSYISRHSEFPKNIAGRTKRLRGPHAARVFETPVVNH